MTNYKIGFNEFNDKYEVYFLEGKDYNAIRKHVGYFITETAAKLKIIALEG